MADPIETETAPDYQASLDEAIAKDAAELNVGKEAHYVREYLAQTRGDEGPYYKALLSIISVEQELGSLDEDAIQACLEAEGIGEFYAYATELLQATAGDDFQEDADEEGDPANPEQENDEDASPDDEEEAEPLL